MSSNRVRAEDRAYVKVTICKLCRGSGRPLYKNEPCIECNGNGVLHNGKPYITASLGLAFTQDAINDGIREALDDEQGLDLIVIDPERVQLILDRQPTLSLVWSSYEREVVPEAATQHQRTETRRAWYAGVQYMMGVLNGIASEDEATLEMEAAETALFARIENELQQFLAKVERGIA